jgi:hypothetical protein
MNDEGRRNGWTNPLIPIVFTSRNCPLFSQVAASDIGSTKDRRSMVQRGRPIDGAKSNALVVQKE